MRKVTTFADEQLSPIKDPGSGRVPRGGVLKNGGPPRADPAGVSPIVPSGDLESGDEDAEPETGRRRRSLTTQIQTQLSHQQKVKFRAEEAVRKYDRRSGSPAAAALLAKARLRSREARHGDLHSESPTTSPPTAESVATVPGSGHRHMGSSPAAPPLSPPQPLSPLTASSRENVTGDFSLTKPRTPSRGSTRLSRQMAGKSTTSSAASVSSIGSSVSAGTSRIRLTGSSSVRSYSVPLSGEDDSPKSPEDPSDAMSRSTTGSRYRVALKDLEDEEAHDDESSDDRSPPPMPSSLNRTNSEPRRRSRSPSPSLQSALASLRSRSPGRTAPPDSGGEDTRGVPSPFRERRSLSGHTGSRLSSRRFQAGVASNHDLSTSRQGLTADHLLHELKAATRREREARREAEVLQEEMQRLTREKVQAVTKASVQELEAKEEILALKEQLSRVSRDRSQLQVALDQVKHDMQDMIASVRRDAEHQMNALKDEILHLRQSQPNPREGQTFLDPGGGHVHPSHQQQRPASPRLRKLAPPEPLSSLSPLQTQLSGSGGWRRGNENIWSRSSDDISQHQQPSISLPFTQGSIYGTPRGLSSSQNSGASFATGTRSSTSIEQLISRHADRSGFRSLSTGAGGDLLMQTSMGGLGGT